MEYFHHHQRNVTPALWYIPGAETSLMQVLEGKFLPQPPSHKPRKLSVVLTLVILLQGLHALLVPQHIVNLAIILSDG